MNKFIFRLVILFFLSLPFHRVQAQQSKVYTYEAMDSYQLSGKQLEEKCLQVIIQQSVGSQAPMIRFSLTTSASSKYGGHAAWFEKGKSQYYKEIVDMDNQKVNVLALYSSDFNICVSILQPHESRMRGYISFGNRYDPSKVNESIWVELTPGEVTEIMNVVGKEVKRLGFPKFDDSSLDIE